MIEIIAKYGKYPFGYNWKNNELDCVHFTANIIRDISGKDYLKNFRNKYTSKKEALYLLKQNNYKDLIDAISNEINQEPNSFRTATDGDIVVANNDVGRTMVGICYNKYAFFNGFDQKVLKIPLDKCIYSWSIN